MCFWKLEDAETLLLCSGVFCNPSVPVALGNLCGSESPPSAEGRAAESERSLGPAGRGSGAAEGHIPVEI